MLFQGFLKPTSYEESTSHLQIKQLVKIYNNLCKKQSDFKIYNVLVGATSWPCNFVDRQGGKQSETLLEHTILYIVV